MSIQGVDVSHYQGNVDWQAVAHAGYRFAVVKATESNSVVDARLQGNLAGGRAAGMRVGCYHFARPNGGVADAVAEADHFLAAARVLAGDLPPTLDLEAGDGNEVAWALAFLQHVEQRTGRIPILYSYAPFERAHLGGDARLARYPLWIAAYSAAPPHVAPWSTWTIWQRTSSGTVPGIAGRVDLDVFAGDDVAFDHLCAVPVKAKDPQHPPIGAFSTDAQLSAPYVTEWQTMLRNKAAQHEVVVNGRFDAATVTATKNFQKMAHLPDTGRVDDATWAAMLALKG